MSESPNDSRDKLVRLETKVEELNVLRNELKSFKGNMRTDLKSLNESIQNLTLQFQVFKETTILKINRTSALYGILGGAVSSISLALISLMVYFIAK